MLGRCAKVATFLAENSGVITVNTQKMIEGKANPVWALERIKEEPFDTKNGENPREILTYITQPTRRQYVPILGTGNETVNVLNPQTGEITAVTADKTGRGCSIPADTMQFGYDVRTSCLKARAVEIGPWCILDLIQKNIHREVIQRLWSDVPPMLRMQFARQLLREIITLGKFKYSATAGVPFSTDVPYFPAIPTGGPDIGMMRRIKTSVMPWGYADGSGVPMIDGQAGFQFMIGGDALEWAIETRKTNKGYKIETTKTADDKVFGKTTTYEGMQFITDDRPTRGVIVPVGAGKWDFVEIEPTSVIEAEGEGFKEVPNPLYEEDWIVVNGDRRRVLEVAYWAHPQALVRESLGAMPAMPGGKTFNRKFDMSINPIPDYELADRGCNKDMFFFGYRALHAFAMKRRRHELAGAFLYIAPRTRYDVTDPWTNADAAELAQVGVRDLPKPLANTCEPCDIAASDLAEVPVVPTCEELFPDNVVGVMRMRQTGYDVDEGAGTLTIAVERVNGDSGAASLVLTLAEGTATNPENFTTPAGFAGIGPWTKSISWLDGEEGIKTVVIPIVEAVGDDDGKVFTASIGTAVGATIDGTRNSATITILDPDEAA